MRTKAIGALLACVLALVYLAVPASAKRRPTPRLTGTSTCVDGTGNDATYDANRDFADLVKVTLTANGGRLRIEWVTTGPVVSDPRGWWITLQGSPGRTYQVGLTVKDGSVSERVIDVADYVAKQRAAVDPYAFNGATTTLTVPLKAFPNLGTRSGWRAVATAGFRSDGDMCSGPDGALLPIPSSTTPSFRGRDLIRPTSARTPEGTPALA